jgi:DNA-binding NtrC family response regulator
MPNPDLTLLIVEDEEKIRLTLKDYFEDLGWRVWLAASGEQGLNMIARHEIQVCTVDIRLPRISGEEFIKQAHRLNPNLRFLIYTGSSDYELPEELQAMGIASQDVLIKPTDSLEVLAQAISRLAGSGS